MCPAGWSCTVDYCAPHWGAADACTTGTCARAPSFADSASHAAQFHDKDDSSWSGKDSGWSGKDSGWSGGDDKPSHMKHDEGWSKQPQQPQPSSWSQPQPQPQPTSWSQPQPEAPKKDDKPAESWSQPQPQQPAPEAPKKDDKPAESWSQPQPQQPAMEAPKKDDKQVRTCLPRGTCSCACVTKCFSIQAHCREFTCS